MIVTETTFKMMRASGAMDMAAYDTPHRRKRRRGRRVVRAVLFVAAGLAAGAGAGLALLAWAKAAEAQAPSCAPRQAVIDRLSDGYGESQTGSGVTRNGYLVELYQSPSGSWTLIATRPDGMSCLIAAGQGWERNDPPTAVPKGQGA